MQDTVTYAHPCKCYAGKRFLLNTREEIYKKYLKQTEFHRHGILAKTTKRVYKPKYILLSGLLHSISVCVTFVKIVNF